MELLITSTDMLTLLEGLPCRVWEGTTDAGLKCLVFIYRIAMHPDADSRAFDAALTEQLPPGRVVDLRRLL
jgi:hypothetical protein